MNLALTIAIFATVSRAAIASGTLAITWDDCGDASTKAKITSLTPASLTLGQKTVITGTGNLSEDVAGADFDLVMTGLLGVKLLECQGDASVTKTCSLPAGTGTIGLEALSFPIKTGTVGVNIDLNLGANLPSSLATTTTKVTSVGKNGDKIFCVNVHTAPASEPSSPSLFTV